MRKVYLSAGHTNVTGQDRGAVSKSGTWIEGVEAVIIRDLLKEELIKRGATVIVDDNRNALAKTLAAFKGLVGVADIAIDIHFDAGGGTGCSVFIPVQASKLEQNLAADLSGVISNVLKVRNRGVKTELDSHHKTLACMRLACENILIETCFIDNTEDMKSYDFNKIVLVKSLADTIYLHSIK